jgi:hypothetical protein
MNAFKEDNGNTSMTRILSLVIVAAGLTVGIIGMLTKTLTTEAVTLSLGLVTIGSGLKAASKGLEK